MVFQKLFYDTLIYSYYYENDNTFPCRGWTDSSGLITLCLGVDLCGAISLPGINSVKGLHYSLLQPALQKKMFQVHTLLGSLA